MAHVATIRQVLHHRNSLIALQSLHTLKNFMGSLEGVKVVTCCLWTDIPNFKISTLHVASKRETAGRREVYKVVVGNGSPDRFWAGSGHGKNTSGNLASRNHPPGLQCG